MKNTRAVVATPWWVRLATYVIVAIIGLVATALGVVQPDQVDQWLGQVGSLAALIGGLMAATHTGRASDETPAQEMARLNPIVEEPAPVSYDQLRNQLGEE